MAGIVSLLLGWYLVSRYLVIPGSISIKTTDQTVTVWLDGTIAKPSHTSNALILKTIPGKHTVTLQNAAGQEEKAVIDVASAHTSDYLPQILTQPENNPDQLATAISDASFVHQSLDGKYLYFLNGAGTTMWRYNSETGVKVTISDPIFQQPNDISFSNDETSVVMKSKTGNWFLFPFRKDNFLQSSFQAIESPSVLAMAYDPSRPRLGKIIPDPVAVDKRDFVVQDTEPGQEQLLTILNGPIKPHFVWAPHGRSIAIIDDQSYNKNNLYFYDIALDAQRSIPTVENASRVVFDASGENLLIEEQRGAETWLKTYAVSDGTTREVGKLWAPGLAAWDTKISDLTAILTDGQTADHLNLTKVASDGTKTVVGQIPNLPHLKMIWNSNSSSQLYALDTSTLWHVNIRTEQTK